jgi:hypothetical protein
MIRPFIIAGWKAPLKGTMVPGSGRVKSVLAYILGKGVKEVRKKQKITAMLKILLNID